MGLTCFTVFVPLDSLHYSQWNCNDAEFEQGRHPPLHDFLAVGWLRFLCMCLVSTHCSPNLQNQCRNTYTRGRVATSAPARDRFPTSSHSIHRTKSIENIPGNRRPRWQRGSEGISRVPTVQRKRLRVNDKTLFYRFQKSPTENTTTGIEFIPTRLLCFLSQGCYWELPKQTSSKVIFLGN
jgi:hypothetical protein